LGPNVLDGSTPNNVGDVACTVGGTDNAELTFVMDNDLTTTGEWGDEKMIWTLSV